MTNEEKATELGIKYQIPCHGIGDCEFEARQAALEMVEWKENQMIKKAVEWLEENISDYEDIYYDVGGYVSPEFRIEECIEDFKKAMKGGEE